MHERGDVFYRHTKFEGVDTYTRAEYNDSLQDYVHHLITPEEFAKAEADGELTETEDL